MGELTFQNLFAARVAGARVVRQPRLRCRRPPANRAPAFEGPGLFLCTTLSDTMYSLISLRKSTPPQNRQLDILIHNRKR